MAKLTPEEFLSTYVNVDKKIAQLKEQLKSLRKPDKGEMNRALRELLPGLPEEYVLVRRRIKPTAKKK